MWNRFRTPKNSEKKKGVDEGWNAVGSQLYLEPSDYQKVIEDIRTDMRKSAKRITSLEEAVNKANIEREAATMTSRCITRAVDGILIEMKNKETQITAERMAFKAIASAYAWKHNEANPNASSPSVQLASEHMLLTGDE